MGEWIRCGVIALLRYCVCQCVAALPVLVGFLLLAAAEDYCDSPDFLSISVCLPHSLHPLGTLVSGLIKATQALYTRVEYFCWSEQALTFTPHSFNQGCSTRVRSRVHFFKVLHFSWTLFTSLKKLRIGQ